MSKNNNPLMEDTISTIIKDTTNINTQDVKDIWDKTKVRGGENNIDRVRRTIDATAGELTDPENDKFLSTASINRKINKHTLNTSSIIARAKNSILQFPLYVTQTLRVNEASIIGKLFERVYADLVKTVLAAHPIITQDEANDLLFLKKFHSNLQESTEALVNKYYEPIDDIDTILTESVFHKQQISDNCTLEFSAVPKEQIDEAILFENARLINEPLAGFAYLAESRELENTHEQKTNALDNDDVVKIMLNDIERTLPRGQYQGKGPDPNAELRQVRDELDQINQDNRRLLLQTDDEIRKEVENDRKTREPIPPTKPIANRPSKDDPDYEDRLREFNRVNDTYNNDMANYRRDLEAYKSATSQEVQTRLQAKRDAEAHMRRAIDHFKDAVGNSKVSGFTLDKAGRLVKLLNTSKVTTKNHDELIQKAVPTPELLRDADIKKLNNITPWVIKATFRIKGNATTLSTEVSYLIGVKTVMHLIRTQDLVDDLEELVTGHIKSLQKVRYKTGEISFKDYFLNVKNIKADALKRLNGNKRWVNTLKRLSEFSRANGSLLNTPAKAIREITNGSIPIPNGTLILAQPDVTTLTNQTGIDISEITNVRKLAKSLFLIAVVIVDSSAGTMRVFFPDQDNDWDVQSLASIDAEISKTDNSSLLRELNKVVNR